MNGTGDKGWEIIEPLLTKFPKTCVGFTEMVALDKKIAKRPATQDGHRRCRFKVDHFSVSVKTSCVWWCRGNIRLKLFRFRAACGSMYVGVVFMKYAVVL